MNEAVVSDAAKEPSPYAVLAVVAVGTFMAAISGSLLNVAVPLIRAHFAADLGAASWVLAAYSLAVSSLLLTVGRLGDLWGRRRVCAIGFAVFGVSSALCAAAPSLGALVALRALQGAGAAMLMATGPAILTAAFPPAQRGRALGLWATATYVGLTMGPSLGGWLAGRFGWPAVFLVNVPIAALGALLALRVLRPSAPAAGATFPWASAILFGCALTAILVALTRGARWGWTSPVVLGLAALGVTLAIGFVVAERRSDEPMVPSSLLRVRSFSSGLVAAFLQYCALYMLLFLLPFELQGPRGMSAGEAGTVMTAQPAAMVLLTGASGWLSDRVGSRGPTVLGMISLAGGLAWIGTIERHSSTASLIVGLALAGVGSGLFTSPNNSSIMGAAPRDRQGTAGGLLAEARNVGMLAGVAVAGVLFAAMGGGRLEGAARGEFAAAFEGTLLVAAGLAGAGGVVSALRRGGGGG